MGGRVEAPLQSIQQAAKCLNFDHVTTEAMQSLTSETDHKSLFSVPPEL